MLINPHNLAQQHYIEHTAREIELIREASLQTAQVAAAIAMGMGRVDVANEILRRAME